MKSFKVFYGDSIKTMVAWRCQARNKQHAIRLFRDEFGFNYIKIQEVKEC